jgi:hypothetical protein
MEWTVVLAGPARKSLKRIPAATRRAFWTTKCGFEVYYCLNRRRSSFARRTAEGGCPHIVSQRSEGLPNLGASIDQPACIAIILQQKSCALNPASQD